MSKSTSHANAVLDNIGYSSATAFGATYISLHTGDPGTTGASEVTGGSYARVLVNRDRTTSPYWAAAASGSMANEGAVAFEQGGGDAAVTHFGVWSAATSGTFLRGGTCTNFTYASNVTPEFADGAVTLSET